MPTAKSQVQESENQPTGDATKTNGPTERAGLWYLPTFAAHQFESDLKQTSLDTTSFKTAGRIENAA